MYFENVVNPFPVTRIACPNNRGTDNKKTNDTEIKRRYISFSLSYL